MIYDVRVGALLDGSQEIYTIIQSVEASSVQGAAEQVVRSFEDGAEGHEEDWYDGDNDECVDWKFDGEHTVEIDPVVVVTQVVTVDHKATIKIITE